MSRRLGWVLPGAPVLLAAGAAWLWAPRSLLLQAGGGYAWVAYAVTLLLAWLFQRSRVAVAVVALAGLRLVLLASSGFGTAAVAGAVLALVLAALALVRDRGVLSSAAMVQLGGAAGLTGVFALVAVSDPPMVARTLSATPLPAFLTSWTGLPQAVALAFLVAAVATAWGAFRWRGAVEKGLLWCVPTVAVAVASGLAERGAPTAGVAAAGAAATPTVGLFLLAAALILALSMVETSYAMAYRDDLTGLPARRALQRDLEGLGTAYAIAMVDVDHFKRFNDRHGHDVGDQVLRLVASRLARAPGGAKAYRYGGEEFTLLFPGRTREEALPHLEAVRAAVEAARFALRSRGRPRTKPPAGSRKAHAPSAPPKELSVTVSLGVADARGKDTSPESVLKKADQALYRAKKAGRNQVAK